MKNILRNRKEKEDDHSSSNVTNEVKKASFINYICTSLKNVVKNKIQSKHKYSLLIGLFITFLIFCGFFRYMTELYHTHFYNFKYIDVSNTEKLKEIFFSNNPYLVYCKNDKNTSIHPVINASRSNLPDILNIAVINCKSVLPSKQNIYQRFSLEDNTPAFVICYGKKPKPISVALLNNKKKFITYVREALVFNVPFFSKFPQFQTKCLNKNKKCVLFIYNIELTTKNIQYNYINDLFVTNKYFNISPLIIDNKRFLIKLNNELNKSYFKKNDVHVLCLFNDSVKNVETFYGFFYNDNFDDFKKLSTFVSTCINANNQTKQAIKLSEPPQIKYRPVKQTKQ